MSPPCYKVGKKTMVDDYGSIIVIYAANMIPRSFIIPPTTSEQNKELLVSKAKDLYENRRRKTAEEYGELESE